jgi:hypothetical protein
MESHDDGSTTVTFADVEPDPREDFDAFAVAQYGAFRDWLLRHNDTSGVGDSLRAYRAFSLALAKLASRLGVRGWSEADQLHRVFHKLIVALSVATETVGKAEAPDAQTEMNRIVRQGLQTEAEVRAEARARARLARISDGSGELRGQLRRHLNRPLFERAARLQASPRTCLGRVRRNRRTGLRKRSGHRRRSSLTRGDPAPSSDGDDPADDRLSPEGAL